MYHNPDEFAANRAAFVQSVRSAVGLGGQVVKARGPYKRGAPISAGAVAFATRLRCQSGAGREASTSALAHPTTLVVRRVDVPREMRRRLEERTPQHRLVKMVLVTHLQVHVMT